MCHVARFGVRCGEGRKLTVYDLNLLWEFFFFFDECLV